MDTKALNAGEWLKNQQIGCRNRNDEMLERRTAVGRGITCIPENDDTSGIGFVFIS